MATSRVDLTMIQDFQIIMSYFGASQLGCSCSFVNINFFIEMKCICPVICDGFNFGKYTTIYDTYYVSYCFWYSFRKPRRQWPCCRWWLILTAKNTKSFNKKTKRSSEINFLLLSKSTTQNDQLTRWGADANSLSSFIFKHWVRFFNLLVWILFRSMMMMMCLITWGTLF